jgi:hypothetical protein
MRNCRTRENLRYGSLEIFRYVQTDRPIDIAKGNSPLSLFIPTSLCEHDRNEGNGVKSFVVQARGTVKWGSQSVCASQREARLLIGSDSVGFGDCSGSLTSPNCRR